MLWIVGSWASDMVLVVSREWFTLQVEAAKDAELLRSGQLHLRVRIGQRL